MGDNEQKKRRVHRLWLDSKVYRLFEVGKFPWLLLERGGIVLAPVPIGKMGDLNIKCIAHPPMVRHMTCGAKPGDGKGCFAWMGDAPKDWELLCPYVRERIS